MSSILKLVVDGGLAPSNAVQQLVNWKLLPPLSSPHGPLTTEHQWRSVDDFVDALRKVIQVEASTIRETELQEPGKAARAVLHFKDGPSLETSVTVDKLGRVTVPATVDLTGLMQISASGSPAQNVIRIEHRFVGDAVQSRVCYLEESSCGTD